MLRTTRDLKTRRSLHLRGLAMSAMMQQHSLAQTWKRRRRWQRILVAVVVAALFAALAYGWLHVFGMV
jgi:hypothetical protein